MCHILISYLLVKSCFHFLAIISRVEINGVGYCSLGIWHRKLDCMLNLFLTFWGFSILISRGAGPICKPTNHKGICPLFYILSIFNFWSLCWFLPFWLMSDEVSTLLGFHISVIPKTSEWLLFFFVCQLLGLSVFRCSLPIFMSSLRF